MHISRDHRLVCVCVCLGGGGKNVLWNPIAVLSLGNSFDLFCLNIL